MSIVYPFGTVGVATAVFVPVYRNLRAQHSCQYKDVYKRQVFLLPDNETLFDDDTKKGMIV